MDEFVANMKIDGMLYMSEIDRLFCQFCKYQLILLSAQQEGFFFF